MDLVFKKIGLFILLFISMMQLHAQINLDLSLNPPFTPFISDYVRPERIDDIQISLFNGSAKNHRLKFKFSVQNAAKGINISIKETTVPLNPLVLEANEFKFLKLEDVSNLYGKLNQNNFNLTGASIQNLILDGTIPDGLYEVCVQAFDFDVPGFTVPLSGNSPSGCFTFVINYTDPPTDIRFNVNLLQYSFGGTVPKIGMNSLLGQNYNIQFTSPALNFGSQYEYTLYIFDETSINPSLQRESNMLEAIQTLNPIIKKTSTIPFFTITPGDIELDFNKNYYLLIEATDLNRKTLFKNKGFSAFKAFKLNDTKPVIYPSPSFEKPTCGATFTAKSVLTTLVWNNNLPSDFNPNHLFNIKTQLKIVKFGLDNQQIPVDIFARTFPNTVLDTTVSYLAATKLLESFSINGRFGNNEQNNNTRWVIGVKNFKFGLNDNAPDITFENEGKVQCNIAFQTQVNPLLIELDYPLNNDTIPFQYPPVVFKSNNLGADDKLIFTQFNSMLELIESNKYLKATTDVAINNELQILGLDTLLGKINALLNKAATYQLDQRHDASQRQIELARDLLNASTSTPTVQITHALNAKNIPLGNSTSGKMAIFNNLFRYNAAQQLTVSSNEINYPNMGNLIYLNPYKNGINWNCKIGVYSTNPFMNGGISLSDFENGFRNNDFDNSEMQSEMLKKNFKASSGQFNVGMKQPLLQIHYLGQKVGNTVTFKFLPSSMPNKLLPTADNNDVWREFEQLNVSQQWNLEIASDVNFTNIDTVISKKIVKEYAIKDGPAPIIQDLYSPVEINYRIYEPGKYFWRVTWSNPVVSSDATAQEKAYYTQLGNLLATSQFIGQDVSEGIAFESLFFIRRNYKFSDVDSFEVSDNLPRSNTVKPPVFELVYPVNGDTLPFMYPPVVIKNNQLDSSYKFVLTEFNSKLEPFVNHNYYLLDSASPSAMALKNSSYDSLQSNLIRTFDQMALEQFQNGADVNQDLEGTINEFITQNKKNTHIQYFTTPNSNLLVLGNSPNGKQKLAQLVSNRKANEQNLLDQEDNTDPERANIGGLLYLKPTKNINWNARFAYYTPIGLPTTKVDSFEQLFSAHSLHYGSNISTENKQGVGFLTGSFSVGMRSPIIVKKMAGSKIAKNNVSISFKPSAQPTRLFPTTENNQAWLQWKELMVAQQWNIEVSKTARFDTIIYTKSKAIVANYSVPGSAERVMNDLYNQVEEKLDLPQLGKYFYRITWSNPVNLDSNNSFHKAYAKMQLDYASAQQTIGDDGTDDIDIYNFYHLKKTNYSFSDIDSFEIVDSSSLKIDTAQCGLSCSFNLSGIQTIAANSHILVNDMVDVGLFKMKIKTISNNLATSTYSGTGSIKCNLFPAPIAVVFLNVKFNAQRRLVEGTIKAENKKDDIIRTIDNNTNMGDPMYDKIKSAVLNYIPTAINKGGNRATDGQIPDLYNYLNSPACLIANHLMGQEVTMPFGLSKEVDNFPYTIAVTDIEFSPTQAKFNAASLLKFKTGIIEQIMGFGAIDLCLTPGGTASLENGGDLELIGSIDMYLGDLQKLKILGRGLSAQDVNQLPGTRLVWDCKGFKHLDLKVSLEMDRSVMVPVHGKKVASGKVTATGHAVISSLNNWLISLNFDTTFQLTAVPGHIFKAKQAALDLSDLANAQGMVFPTNYLGDKGNTWQGVYIKEVGIRLPDFFREKDTLAGLSFNAQHILLDNSGITASIGFDNLLTIDDGTLAGWKYSIGRINLDIVNSVPTTFQITGNIRTPILQGELGYDLLLNKPPGVDSLNAQFNITVANELAMPAMFASVNLSPNSTIKIVGNILDPQSLSLQSNFNGNIAIGADDIAGLKDVRFGSLPFEGMKVSTKFSDLSSFSFTLDRLGGIDMNRVVSNNTQPAGNVPATNPPGANGIQKTGGFPIAIQDFSLDAFNGKCLFDLNPEVGTRIGIKFKIIVNVAEIGPVGIGGQCNLGIYASPKKLNDLWQFIPCGLNVDTIRVKAKLCGALDIEGGIAFMNNDPVFGNGVAGFVKGTMPMFELGITGMFGEIRGMRYWMFGASLGITPGIPIDFSANVIYANYASFELWSKMNRTPGTAADAAAGFRIGRSPSGASFLPDNRESFGFGGALGLTGPPGSPLFGDMGLYAQFTNDGGLSKLTMEGNLWMTTKEKATAEVFINGNLTIDVSNQKLIGNMSALVNVAGGTVRGRIDTTFDGKTYYIAGTVDLLVDIKNNNWHIKVGNPFINKGKVGFGFYAASELIFNAGGYFMMGNKLPKQLPPMDAELVKKLTAAGIIIPATNPSNSTGFAVLMGVDANIPEKRIDLGPFYLGVELQFAVDGLLTNGGLRCAGRNGINGWYMTGKAYAYMHGALGMHVATPFYSGDVIAAKISSGMVLDAGLLNPYYFKGQFAANYSVLGGLIEGSKRFDFELAEDPNCIPNIQTKVANLGQIVADASPAKNSTDVLVGVEPVIALNYALNKEIKFESQSVIPGTTTTIVRDEMIRVKYENVKLYDHTGRYSRKVSLIVSTDGFELFIRPDSFLRDKRTQYTLSATFFIERYNEKENAWQKVIRENKQPWDTSILVSFTTELQATFQTDYIVYSTPREGENYFKKGDYTYGKIVCNRTDVKNTFFNNVFMTNEIRQIRGYDIYYGQYAVAGNLQDTQRVELSFVGNEIRFNLPQTVDPEKLYQFRLIKEHIPGNALVNQPRTSYNVTQGYQQRTNVASKIADTRLMMHSFVFKTSKYNTLAQKIENLNITQPAFSFISGSPIVLKLSTSEPFEVYETSNNQISGMGGTLLSPSKVLAVSSSILATHDNDWIVDFYRPKIYKAGDSLQRKKSTLAAPFLDLTKNKEGVSLVLNEHIIEPLPNNHFGFLYDLRLADTRILQLKSNLLQANTLRTSGIVVQNATLMQDNGLTIDSRTGQISSGGLLIPNPNIFTTSSSSSGSSTTQTPAIGSQLHVNYTKHLIFNSELQRVKTLANRIIVVNPTNWHLVLTSKERALVVNTRSNNYKFVSPTSSQKFVVGLHVNSPISKQENTVSLNSNILETISLPAVKKTIVFSAFGR